MNIILRPYQLSGIHKIKESFKKGIRSLIMCAPTGSGKTIMFSYLAKKVSEKGKKVLILTDRIELLMQSGGAIKQMGLNPFYLTAGIKSYNRNYNCFVAMSQTLRRREWNTFFSEIDLVIIDEAHKQEFNWFFKEQYNPKKIHVIGFTATPERRGKMRQLGLDYEIIIDLISVKELIELGFLVSDDYYGFKAPDVSDVQYSYVTGDYNSNQMFAKFNNRSLYAGVIKNYIEICNNTKTLVFCVNIEHAIKTCLEFNKNNISAKFIVSEKSKPSNPESPQGIENLRVYEFYKDNFNIYSGERQRIFKDFENDKFKILVNVDIATTGYDCPSIETVIINRKTMSRTLLYQMIGRGARIFEGKTHFNILDFGDNCNDLGYYTEKINWSLWHEESKKGGIPPMKNCGLTGGKPIISDSGQKGCTRLILAMYAICPFCGFKYPKKKTKEVELNLIVSNKITKKIPQMNDNELIEYWKSKGHKTAWLWRQLYYRGGNDKIEAVGNQLKWKKSTIIKAQNFCKRLGMR